MEIRLVTGRRLTRSRLIVMKVILGLSGGVDSAVSALLLKEQDHDVTAVFMKNWDDDDDEDYCPAEQDLADARAVCEKLNIELLTISFSAEYWDRVFRNFLDEYQANRTPNPDIICNREIKFGAFIDYAKQLGADCIATGHYASISSDEGYRLLKSKDPAKDQTYFLYTLDQSQLGRAMFPVGNIEKGAVRELAAKHGLPVFDKKDSTGICFIGERKFNDFLARYLKKNPGDIRSLDGVLLGQHDGLMFYTIGQRQGLGIGGRKDASGEPWYVYAKEPGSNTLQVVQGVDHPALFSKQLEAESLHWISGFAPDPDKEYTARIRHQQMVQDCTFELTGKHGCEVVFKEPQRAVTPGQSIVFYEGQVCLGGGVINRSSS
jgi:tRNA-specific 2-thiouridylase